MTDANVAEAPARGAYLGRVAMLLVGLIVAAMVVDLTLVEHPGDLVREGGGLETITAFYFALAIVAFFAVVPARIWPSLFEIPAMFALFAMRELDFDKAFTKAGILSTKFYAGDSALMTKVIGGAVALFAAFVLLRVVWRGGPAALRALRVGELWPRFAVIAGVLVVFSKSIDGLARKLGGFGIEISQGLHIGAIVAEEFAEAGIAVCGILAILARWKGRSA